MLCRIEYIEKHLFALKANTREMTGGIEFFDVQHAQPWGDHVPPAELYFEVTGG
jgi:hypothetical protein